MILITSPIPGSLKITNNGSSSYVCNAYTCTVVGDPFRQSANLLNEFGQSIYSFPLNKIRSVNGQIFLGDLQGLVDVIAQLIEVEDTPVIPIDPAAQAYLTAAGISTGQVYEGNGTTDYPLTSERIISSVNDLFLALKAEGLYTKLKCLYPFLGVTNANNFVNAINPGTHDLVPNPGTFGGTLSRNGITFDNNSYLATGIFMTDFDEYSFSAGFYDITGSGGFDFGTNYADFYDWGAAFHQKVSFKDPGNTTSYTPDEIHGLNLMSTTAGNHSTYYIKNDQKLLVTAAGIPSIDFTGDIFLGNIHWPDSHTAGGSTKTCATFFMADGLSDSECVTMYGIMEDFQLGVRRGFDNVFQYFGDSITIHEVANPVYHGWSTGLCYDKQSTELNWGVGGTTIVDCNTTAINNLIPKDSKHTKVFVSFNTNDYYLEIGIPTYISNYTDVIGKILAAGYTVNDIAIIAGYFNGTLDASYAAKSALQDTYISALMSTAAGLGITRCYNLKPPMIANGGNALISGIHPNNDGHGYIGGYMNTALTDF